MAQPERRRSPREKRRAPVAVLMAAGTLAGETEDVSRGGVLVRSSGRIVVILKLKGREYRGILVRVSKVDERSFAYAVELEQELEE